MKATPWVLFVVTLAGSLYLGALVFDGAISVDHCRVQQSVLVGERDALLSIASRLLKGKSQEEVSELFESTIRGTVEARSDGSAIEAGNLVACVRDRTVQRLVALDDESRCEEWSDK